MIFHTLTNVKRRDMAIHVVRRISTVTDDPTRLLKAFVCYHVIQAPLKFDVPIRKQRFVRSTHSNVCPFFNQDSCAMLSKQLAQCAVALPKILTFKRIGFQTSNLLLYTQIIISIFHLYFCDKCTNSMHMERPKETCSTKNFELFNFMMGFVFNQLTLQKQRKLDKSRDGKLKS